MTTISSSSGGSGKASGHFINSDSGSNGSNSSGSSSGSGNPIFSTIWKPFSWTWRIFKKWILPIGLIVLIVIMVYTWGLGYGGFQSAIAQSQVQAEKGGAFGAVAEAFVKVKDSIFHPEKVATTYGFESEIQQNENNPDLGVHIKAFKQLGKTFTNEPISLTGTLAASGFKETLEIETFCSMDVDSGTYKANELIPAKLSGIEVAGNKAKFYPGSNAIVAADCYFPQGIKPSKEIILGKEQTITTKRAKLLVTYNFISMASMKLYTLGWDEYQQVLHDPKTNDPFTYYAINEPKRSMMDGTIKSIATDGPINLGVGTYVTQPFSENREYPFGVTISPSSVLSTGNLKRLDSVEVAVPEFIYLQGDTEYSSELEASQCAFENTGQLDQDGFKVYKLKESLKDQLNNECADETLKSSRLTKTDCYNLHWQRLDFRCRFKVIPQQPLGTMSYDYMRATARYVFTGEMPAVVTVYNMPDTPIIQ